jgi:hypothetical protein
MVPSQPVAAWLALPGVVVTWLVTGFPDLSEEGRSDMKARHETNLADTRLAARRTMRVREAREVRRRLDAVIAAVDALDMPWGVWADTVRQDVEARHGVAYPAPIEETDAVALRDPEYGAALDCVTALDRVKQALQDALASFNQAEQL